MGERREGECSIGDATKSRSMGGAYLNIFTKEVPSRAATRGGSSAELYLPLALTPSQFHFVAPCYKSSI